MDLAIFLPMAVSADLRFRFAFEESGLTLGQTRELAPPEARCDRHQVGIAKPFVRNEFFHSFMVGTRGAARKRRARRAIGEHACESNLEC